MKISNVEWDDHYGHRGIASCDPREWWGKLFRPFWCDDALLVAIQVDSTGRLTLELLLTALNRAYMLGITAMTWPTHEGPQMLVDSHVNDPPGSLLIVQPSYEALCAPTPQLVGYEIVFGSAGPEWEIQNR